MKREKVIFKKEFQDFSRLRRQKNSRTFPDFDGKNKKSFFKKKNFSGGNLVQSEIPARKVFLSLSLTKFGNAQVVSIHLKRSVAI
jgi:hypothetical protein